MIIKKFQGKNEEEAIEAAKKELGPSIVIMNVKPLKKKGFYKLFSKSKTEVTVALEEESEKSQPSPNHTGFEALVSDQISRSPLREEMKLEPVKTMEQNGKAIEEKLNNLQLFLEQQLQKTEDEKEKEKEKDSEKEDEKENNQQIIFLKLLYNTMIENEIHEINANQMIDEVEKLLKPNMTIDHILANIYQKMILKFEKPQTITPSEKGPKLIYFVGPTGVGKTTTIAKIASKYRVEEKKKIALLTADTYRIAAAEQLRTYASILEVPFRIIYTVEEMEHAYQDFKDYDYIFVDTAGHSHHNMSQKETMEQFIHSLDMHVEKEVYLVLSATTKYRDLIDIADIYSKITEYKLIFTKLDETTTFGNLLNIKLHTKAPMSYITCGQNVPEDILIFNPQNTVKQLLGGKRF